MSKSSRNKDLYIESCRVVQGSYKDYSEWTCEGTLKSLKKVGGYGNLSVISRMYMNVYMKSGRFIVN